MTAKFEQRQADAKLAAVVEILNELRRQTAGQGTTHD